ncbi:MAG TPA: HemK/PrmC family methyltransferase [Actinomycetota bacterium]|jgi:release factor glutamine methyltransferase|nr:HemK/PrmC family methyltransferase [Actinomycetota bacterium]
MTLVKDLLDEGAARLKRSPAIDHWPAGRDRWEAESLLAFVLGAENSFELPSGRAVPGPAVRRYRRLVRRRAGGEPMAHILGWTEFRGLRIAVRPGAFVPRQSTEFLAKQAIRRLRGRRRPVAVDLATGIGPVALAMADAVPRADVHGTDLSAEAVRQARANAKALRLKNATFHRGDLFDSLPRRLRALVDVITLHPPYVPSGEVGDLPLEIRGFEPEHTLTDYSPHGLGLVERATIEGPDWLRPGGWLLVEVSPDRARMVRGLLLRSGYRDVRSSKGWPGVTRTIAGRA